MPRDTALTIPASYQELKRAVLAVALEGRSRVEQAWVNTYHEIGRLIHEHVQLKQARADYGAQVIRRLARDTGMSERSLYECRQFFRCFRIPRKSAKLGWSHYVLLCQVGEAKERTALTSATIREGWTVPELRERVRGWNAAIEVAATGPTPGSDGAAAEQKPGVKLLEPRRGRPGVCRVIADGEALAVDLGFACYLRLPRVSGFAAGDFVQIGGERIVRAAGASKADLFTYEAEILKVVDGDTLWVRVFLRSDQWVKQKLRLRDLDCPEIATPAGKAAKRCTESLVGRARRVIVCTTKPDKYDRYLADVYLTRDDGSEVFLNNALIEGAHAVRKESWEFSDWGP